MIRVHASSFRYSPTSRRELVVVFLGLGIGYAGGEGGRVMTPLMLPALALQVGLLHSQRMFGSANSAQPDRGAAGDGARVPGWDRQTLTVYGLLLAVFSSNALASYRSAT